MDGSVIILWDKRLVDHQAYFSRKKEYGFNLQAVCNHDRKFIFTYMGCIAGAHDSRIYKHTPLYQILMLISKAINPYLVIKHMLLDPT